MVTIAALIPGSVVGPTVAAQNFFFVPRGRQVPSTRISAFDPCSPPSRELQWLATPAL